LTSKKTETSHDDTTKKKGSNSRERSTKQSNYQHRQTSKSPKKKGPKDNIESIADQEANLISMTSL